MANKLATLPEKVKVEFKTLATLPIKTRKSKMPDAITAEGGSGYTRKTKSELFLLAVSNMVSEGKFYESASESDNRFRELIHKVVAKDPDWIRRFVPYLRNELNMRSASIVMAVEYVLGGGPSGRGVIDSALVRADEPAEALGYARSRKGRSLPQPIKRGVADAVRRLYTERNFLKYDSDSAGYRFADVIEIVHPEPKAAWQSELFKYAIDTRHNRPELSTAGLPMIDTRNVLNGFEVGNRRSLLDDPKFPARLKQAGATWEWLSGWLQGPMDKKAWELVIPEMGYMALLRNLRNFEQAGVDRAIMLYSVYGKLTNPKEVAESRQLPLRFYSAFKNIENLTAKAAVNDAIEGTLQNVPSLKGRTLILVDNSSSMFHPLSGKGTINLNETASLFGSALALRAESANLISYGTGYEEIDFTGATPLLELTKRVAQDRGGTETFQTLDATYKGHDRVVILTDEQAFGYNLFSYGGYAAKKPSVDIKAPIYTFNLAGYKVGQLPSGKDGRYTFGGLTDAGFKLIELLERGESQDWPF